MGNYVSSEKLGTILNNYCQGENKDEDIQPKKKLTKDPKHYGFS